MKSKRTQIAESILRKINSKQMSKSQGDKEGQHVQKGLFSHERKYKEVFRASALSWFMERCECVKV